jgi:hypothetical protein
VKQKIILNISETRGFFKLFWNFFLFCLPLYICSYTVRNFLFHYDELRKEKGMSTYSPNMLRKYVPSGTFTILSFCLHFSYNYLAVFKPILLFNLDVM